MQNGILEASAALATALERSDVTSAGELYADDARLLVRSPEPILGRDEIMAYWRAGIEVGLSGITFEPQVLEWIDGTTLELGRYVLSLERQSAPAVEHGSYLVLHTQAPNGSWQRAVEVFNPDEPASARRNLGKEEQ